MTKSHAELWSIFYCLLLYGSCLMQSNIITAKAVMVLGFRWPTIN